MKLLFFYLFLAASTAHAATVMTVKIKITARQDLFCNATLFRSQTNQLHLVTNAHCVSSNPKKIEILKPFRAEVPGVLRIQPQVDLAELALPKKTFAIQKYEPLEFDSATTVGGASAFLNGIPVFYTCGFSLWPVYGNCPVEPLPPFLKLRDVEVLPGMSGGAFVDTSLNLRGILTKFRPFEATALIIPMSVVENFLSENSPGQSPQTGSFKNSSKSPYGDGADGLLNFESDPLQTSPLRDFLDNLEGEGLSYPDPKTREGIFSRLEGDYLTLDGRLRAFDTKNYEPLPWIAHPSLMISVKDSTIDISVGSFPVYDSHNYSTLSYVQGSSVLYSGAFSSDTKVIKFSGESLTCINRNKNKLLCAGGTMALSLTKEKNSLHLRWAYVDPYDRNRILFYFGDLGKHENR